MAGLQLSKFKLFCIICDWEVQLIHDDTLWIEHSQCPKCGGPTDGYKMDRPKFFPPPKRTP